MNPGARLLHELERYRGLRLLGVLDCGGGVTEVVFEEARGRRPNLLSLYSDMRIAHGYVVAPERYVEGVDWPGEAA